MVVGAIFQGIHSIPILRCCGPAIPQISEHCPLQSFLLGLQKKLAIWFPQSHLLTKHQTIVLVRSNAGLLWNTDLVFFLKLHQDCFLNIRVSSTLHRRSIPTMKTAKFWQQRIVNSGTTEQIVSFPLLLLIKDVKWLYYFSATTAKIE